KAVAKKPAVKQPAAKKLPAKQASAKVAAVSAPAAKGATAKKSPLAKQASPKSTGGAAANKVVVVTPNVAAKATAPAGNGSAVIRPSTDVAATIKKLTESLRKMGDQRPTKPASLRRSLKSFLGVETTEEAVQRVLIRLIEDGVVKVDATKGASYPMFGS
ncbi:MAG: nucleotide pyrophosphohydrolase, partial [Betaproteobacteria bacterium]